MAHGPRKKLLDSDGNPIMLRSGYGRITIIVRWRMHITPQHSGFVGVAKSYSATPGMFYMSFV